MPICSNARRYSAKIDLGLASIGKNLNVWYYSFKLHVIIDDNMDIVSITFTNASTHDLSVLEGNFIKGIKGFLIGDKGYIGKQKTSDLLDKDIILITKPRKNMLKFPASSFQINLLKARQKIESVFSTLKYRLNLINRYTQSIKSYFSNTLAAITIYIFSKGPLKLFQDLDFSKFLIS